jgi:hypothetical protein
MNAPLVSLQSKNTNNAKSEVRFKQLIRDLNPWCVHNQQFNAYFEDKFFQFLVNVKSREGFI